MKSKDLVNWQIVSYAYDTLGDDDALTLQNGKNAYGAGSWASSLRYHDGTFYVIDLLQHHRQDPRLHGPRTSRKARGKRTSFRPALHDHSLFFDDDGRVYMIHGGGNIRLTELNADALGDQARRREPGHHPERQLRGRARTSACPRKARRCARSTASITCRNITWPRGGMRTQLIFRADKLTGPYEGRVALQDQGVAQGGLIDTPRGRLVRAPVPGSRRGRPHSLPRAGEMGGRLARPGRRRQGPRRR